MTSSAQDSTSVTGSVSSDPYFLHHSDGPGLVLVSQTLTGNNYASWNRAMTIALSVKNKLAFVDGSASQPSSEDQNRLNSWHRNNNVVISWILNSVSKEISASIIYLETAHDMWKELKERFMQSNGPRIFQIKRQLLNTNQGSYTINVYFTKLKVLWEELSNYNAHCTCGKCTCGGAKDVEHTMSFLMGLNDTYSQIRGQILLMDPIPSVNRIFSLVIQEERQRDIGSGQVNAAMAFNVRSNNNNTNNSKNSSRGNQNQQNYRNFKRSQPPVCMHCKKTGHTQDKCYKLHEFPPGYRTNSNDSRANSCSTENFQPCNESKEHTDAITGLTQDQCEQIIALLSRKLATASVNVVSMSTGLHSSSGSPSDCSSYQSKTPQSHAYPDQIKEHDWQG